MDENTATLERVDMEKAFQIFMKSMKTNAQVAMEMIERGDLPITPQIDDANQAFAKSLDE